jgi:hypothetical protein
LKRDRTDAERYLRSVTQTFHLAAAALFLAGCALPSPRPIWRTLVPVNPYIVDVPDRRDVVFDQRRAAERARRFVIDKLPSTPDGLRSELAGEGFICRRDGDAEMRCAYEEARPPSACLPTIVVSMNVVFPASSPQRRLSADEVRIAASVVEDRSRQDNRGCFPL